MRIGPLGCLGMLCTGVAGWAAGRLPAVFADVAAAVPVARPAPAPQPVAIAAPPAPIILSAPPPQVIVIREAAGTERRVIYERERPAELGWTLPVRSNGEIARAAPEPADEAPATRVPTAERAGTDEAGFALASLAYAYLGRGDRRGAAQNFANALELAPKAENAPRWRKELKRLRQRLTGEAYAVLRDDGPVGLGVNPVLGGGQSSAWIAFTPHPLGKRPVSIVLRSIIATSGGFGASSAGTRSSQIALGAKWQVLPMLSISGERLFAVRHVGRSAWTVRLAGGLAHQFGPVLADVYGEAGVVGFGHFDPFAGVQGRAVVPFDLAPLRIEPGVGLWSGYQHAGTAVGRFDLGPTVSVAWDRWNIRASADYRLKVAGNARPGSGPAVTATAAF